MKTWIVTGGAATGKSSFSQLLVKIGGDQVRYFSCDEKAKSLWEVADCVEKVKLLLGNEVLDERGDLDRVKVREKVFNDPNLRVGLEQIFHPIILDALEAERAHLLEAGKTKVFLAEVPLHYEIHESVKADTVIVVATSQTVQVARLIDRRKLDAITAENLLKAQLPLNVKVNKADSVVWNDGSQTMLEAQALMILSDLTKF